ncbi:hypothetical protein QQS21_011029 [Conoideocrella luteorostrata]|uniref:Zn(2)-C6 fungal-type domain-containing protein n=1 Tax=Conoideocrella luteorostrata TaxID=1105319 RepID=A0AAJ0CGL2_9HYPO|nr:hypothetical protein QQS21_011029 [Conoideocrella luteorostrata]
MDRSQIIPPMNCSTDSGPPTTARVQRKGSRKAGGGCITCKVRKIKCDETRPYCLRCLRTGRQCDGYPVTSQPSTILSRAVMQAHPDFESQAEARAFDFYLKSSSAALSGDMDTELWCRMVIQLSIREPAVKHAALAISSLHRRVDMTYREDRQKRQSLDVDERFALTQYGKAMQALRLWKPAAGDQDRATIPLILCLLFVAIEFLRGDQESSQLHICQGRKILAELREGDLPPHSSELLKRHLVPMYRRLGLACYLFTAVPVPIPGHFRDHIAAESENKHEITAFASIDQARDELYSMLDELVQFVNMAGRAAHSATLPDRGTMRMSAEMLSLKAQQTDLLARLAQWNAALATLSVTLPPAALPTTTMHLLRIHYHVAKTWIATALTPSELCYDEHLQSFSSVVTSSVVLIDAMGKHPAKNTMLAFSFETELIAPLYWTCAKCRHPALRRAALKLLQREEMKTRRENHWSAEAMAALSACLISMEEGGQEMISEAGSGSWDMGIGMGEADSTGDFLASSSTAADDSSRMDMESACTSASEPAAVESLIDKLLRVPTWCPPTIPVYPDFKLLTTLVKESALSVHSSNVPSIPSATETTRSHVLDPNAPTPSPIAAAFGIPESMRIKNTLVGPTSDEGIWITTFRDPPPGKVEWDVKRKFLHL